MAVERAAAEIQGALVLTRRSSEVELELALDLHQRLPQIWELLAGGIDVRRARVLVEGTAHLSIGTAREVTDQLLEQAPGLTTGQLPARLQRLCIETNPEEPPTGTKEQSSVGG